MPLRCRLVLLLLVGGGPLPLVVAPTVGAAIRLPVVDMLSKSLTTDVTAADEELELFPFPPFPKAIWVVAEEEPLLAAPPDWDIKRPLPLCFEGVAVEEEAPFDLSGGKRCSEPRLGNPP